MYLGDFVKQIIIELHFQNVLIPDYHDSRWHDLLFKLKTDDVANKPEFLYNLSFDWDREHPISKDLRDVLCGISCLACYRPYFGKNIIHVRDDIIALWQGEIQYGINMDYMQHAVNSAKSMFRTKLSE